MYIEKKRIPKEEPTALLFFQVNFETFDRCYQTQWLKYGQNAEREVSSMAERDKKEHEKKMQEKLNIKGIGDGQG